MRQPILRTGLLPALAFASFAGLSSAEVTVTERSTVIPTYEVKEADPNPIFYNGRRYQGAQGRVYPYPLLHNLTDNKVNRTYREVILENEFVKISILPELGGRIYYARDKENGYNYLYHNEVVKPALIGMTGAWISGGVEWNIPHHHRATSFMPVDHTVTRHADGSQTVWVGETEWRHRTRWVVGVTLRPGSTLFETTIRVFNTTPYQNTLLVFANAAVHANEDYQVFFPPETQWATFHRKNQFSEWPVSHQRYDGADYTEGVDVSRWENHSKPTSFFEWGNNGNFVAGIDHGEEAGTVIFGNKYVNPGKKLWSWGNNPTGAMWDGLLTDENGPYIELMFGSYSDNQPDYSWMQAREVKEATYWFGPLQGLDEVKRVNENAAISFREEDGLLRFGVKAHRVLSGARIRMSGGDRVLFEEETDLHPNDPYLQTVERPGDAEYYDLTLEITDATGKTLIAYRPEALAEEPMPEPVSPQQDAESIENADDLYYQGLYYEQFHDAYYRPRDFYERAIELNPQHVPALLRTGVLYLKDGEYSTAAGYLERAVDRVAWDYVTPERADPLYYLAMVYNALGRTEEAYELFYKASWDYNFRSAAHHQMALMKSLDGEYARALEHLESARETNTESVDALGLTASLYRRTGRPVQAQAAADRLLGIDPLNFRGFFETFLIGGDERIREDLTAMMRDSRESYLELAVGYGNAGLYDEALELLRLGVESGGEAVSSYPIVHYYLGYYNHRLGNTSEAERHFAAAAKLSHEAVFPFRFETVVALETALEYNPEDGRAWYYLGNIYFEHQPERAIEAWERAVALDDNLAVAHRNLAFAYANVKNNLDATMDNIETALRLNPDDPRYYYEQDVYLKTVRAGVEERLAPFAARHDLVVSDLTTLSQYVELLTLNGEFDEAIDLMENHHFRRWEGGGGVYSFWIYAHLNEAIAALEADRLDDAAALLEASVSYPENLETVSSSFETVVHYYQGVVAEAAGDRERARTFFEKAANGRSREPECRFFAAKAREKLDESETAESMYRSLIESGERDLEGEESVDFFDPFSRQRSASERISEGHFKIALGRLGLNQPDRARESFDRAREHNPALLNLTFSAGSVTRF